MFLTILNIVATACLVLACLLLVLVVLMQRPRQEGLGAAFGGGMTDSMWGAQTTNVLQKFTVYLAFIFFSLSLLTSLVKARQHASAAKPKGVLEQIAGPTTPAIPAPAPKTEAPKTEAPKTEAPKTEAPKTEAPKTEAPKTEAKPQPASVAPTPAAQ